MGQKYRGQPGVVSGLMFFLPENLRGSETSRQAVAGFLDQTTKAAVFLDDSFRFLGGGGIAPEFGGANDLIVTIQRNETMLLSGHCHSGHPSGRARGSRGEGLMHGDPKGADPIPRILLLHCWIPIGVETVGSRTSTDDAGLF